jgi:serine/threonine-protein kinase Chk2
MFTLLWNCKLLALKIFINYVSVEGTDLFDVVCDYGGFCEETTRSIFRQILDAVRYLHNNGVVHRDLKLENILLSSEYKPTLTDLGFAKKIDLSDCAIMRTRCGTPSYVAPEIVQCEGYTKAVDAWALGVILYLLYVTVVVISLRCRLFCEYPFYGETMDELYRQILSTEFSFPAQPKYETSDAVKDLIKSLLKADPKERLSLDDVAAHPWLADSSALEAGFRGKAHSL